MGKKSESILDSLQNVRELKKLKLEDLVRLCQEIRRYILEVVCKTGGHLGASLGTVELTVALHYFFNSPEDKIIWDVGHQCYAHKILTGRKKLFPSLRQWKGISGFPKIDESEYDAYGTGHASTSISAALGFCKARDLKGEDYAVIAVIGDGAMTGGNALEAINQAGYLNTKLLIILNDNRMSISENVGSLSEYTHRIEKTEVYRQVKTKMYHLIEQESGLRNELIELKRHLKEVGSPGLLFEKLGINYLGPIDGHDLREILDSLREAKRQEGPTIIHLRTVKGRGYSPAEENKSRFHGVSPFNIENGEDLRRSKGKSYTETFGDTLVKIAERDPLIVGITAAMSDGTGLAKFKERFPKRFFDAGIAEQHAVVFAAGLARAGLKPVVAIYSTFLQRAYDQIIHDACLQNLPVKFLIDRGGIVGEDGPTHQGSFDLSYLRTIPNMVIMAPKDENELRHMLWTAIQYNQGPITIRYPRGKGVGVPCSERLHKIPIGEGETIEEGEDGALLAIGSCVYPCMQAAEMLRKEGLHLTVINSRFVKPLDTRGLARVFHSHRKIITVEENTLSGGFGSGVLEYMIDHGIGNARVKRIGLPDEFIEHGPQEILREKYGLSAKGIARIVRSYLKRRE